MPGRRPSGAGAPARALPASGTPPPTRPPPTGPPARRPARAAARPSRAAPSQWYSSTDLATGDGPAGLALGSSSSLLFTAGSTLDTSNVNAGGLYSLAVGANGSAGARTLLAGFASGDRPGALAVDPAGPVYIILRGSGTLSTFNAGAVKPFST